MMCKKQSCTDRLLCSPNQLDHWCRRNSMCATSSLKVALLNVATLGRSTLSISKAKDGHTSSNAFATALAILEEDRKSSRLDDWSKYPFTMTSPIPLHKNNKCQTSRPRSPQAVFAPNINIRRSSKGIWHTHHKCQSAVWPSMSLNLFK